MSAEPGAAEAHRLYWESDLPVGAIAERLDVSRRALYDAIDPLPVAGTCPACGGALAYPNRMARDSDVATCAACGQEVEGAAEGIAWDEDSAGPAAAHRTAGEAAGEPSTVRPGAPAGVGRGAAARHGPGIPPFPGPFFDDRAVAILAAAGMGVVAGALLARLLGRRR